MINNPEKLSKIVDTAQSNLKLTDIVDIWGL